MMVEITRADYEAGRVRRRDGGEFRIYAWPDKTPGGHIVGQVEYRTAWISAQWGPSGFCMNIEGQHEHDLILAPRTHTVYINIFNHHGIEFPSALLFNDEQECIKAAEDASRHHDCRVVVAAHPIQIED